jgi:type II secretory pathway pseudopilin PulG
MVRLARAPVARRNSEAGETLVEVIIAITILGIVAVALLGAILTSQSGSDVSRQAAQADELLRSAAAQVFLAARSTPWDPNTGCLPADPQIGGTVSATRVQPANGQCSGFQGVELTVPVGGTTQSLEIWVRQP